MLAFITNLQKMKPAYSLSAPLLALALAMPSCAAKKDIAPVDTFPVKSFIEDTRQGIESTISFAEKHKRLASARAAVIKNPKPDGDRFLIKPRTKLSTLCIDATTGEENIACNLPAGAVATIIATLPGKSDTDDVIFATTISPDKETLESFSRHGITLGETQTLYFLFNQATVDRLNANDCSADLNRYNYPYFCRLSQ